jgi:hypothetical protein
MTKPALRCTASFVEKKELCLFRTCFDAGERHLRDPETKESRDSICVMSSEDERHVNESDSKRPRGSSTPPIITIDTTVPPPHITRQQLLINR